MGERGAGREGRLCCLKGLWEAPAIPLHPGEGKQMLWSELEVQSLGWVIPKSSGDIWRDKVEVQDCHHPTPYCGPTWGLEEGWGAD